MVSRRAILYAGFAGGCSLTAGCGALADDPASTSRSDEAEPALWPTFGFDRRNTAHNPTARAPTEEPAVEWQYRVGPEQQAAPIVTSLGNSGTSIVFVWGHNSGLYALNAASGEIFWEWFPGAARARFPRSPGEMAEPTVQNGVVYTGYGGKANNVFGIDPTDNSGWEFQTSATVYSPTTVTNETVFVGTGIGETSVYALETKPQSASGSARWSASVGGWVQAAPAVANGLVYVACRDQRIYTFDAQTGGEEWAVKTGEMAVSAPTVAGGTVFAGSHDGFVYALDAETGDEQWAFETGSPVAGSPAVANGSVYVGSHDGHVYAISATEGTEQWSVETEGKVTASPAVVADTVYVGSHDHRLYALEAATGDERWTLKTNGPVYEGVAIADGRIYLVSGGGNLYALAAD